MDWKAKWIKPSVDTEEVAPIFQKTFYLEEKVKKAKLVITSLGVYEAMLNGKRVGNFIMAPGWTSYQYRLQYQTYDVTENLQKENELTVTVGKGWYRSRLVDCITDNIQQVLKKAPAGLLVQIELEYENGTHETIVSDETWKWSESKVRFSQIYDGEIYDGTYEVDFDKSVLTFEGPWKTLLPQQGPEVVEQERLSTTRMFTTPKGETVIDFGQEITGYIETNVEGKAGDVVDLSFAEVMDQEGNFYTENYRTAKAQYHYICRDGRQTYKPKLTFWGFRYIRVNAFPGGVEKINEDTFTAIVVHSDMKRIGHLECSNKNLNQLFSNIIWGQKGNFLDVPTDCPQRDERLGWTGDAQVFTRAACLNFDTEKFYTKWLADVAADQREDGYVPHIVPDLMPREDASSVWADVATISPWMVYQAYGNPAILKQQFASMKKWVDYITEKTTKPNLWIGGTAHYGDWLALDAVDGNWRGVSDIDFIASAFYAYSTSLVVKAGHVIGEEVAEYEVLYENIVKAFREHFPECHTQTECALAVYFGLAEDGKKVADQLANMVLDCGTQLKTGFTGTPYLLHALSAYGYSDIAYSLLLREEYPSWLYSVKKGATTIWEHWDGIMEDGNFWSSEMNSFNHYAYGAVADWVYMVAAGIRTEEEAPGYEKAIIAPTPDVRLDWLKATLETPHGLISSAWKKVDGMWRYEITTPVETTIRIGKKEHHVGAGTYLFYDEVR